MVLAPALVVSETANGLWKYVKARDLTLEEAIDCYEQATSLVDTLVPDHELAVEAIATADSTGHPVYDCLYVTLARRLGARLLTLDTRLNSLASELGVV